MKRCMTLIFVLGAFCVFGDVLLQETEPVFVDTRNFKEWRFAPVDSAKGRVVVEFKNHIDYPRPAGFCPCWQILVNGKILTASATRTHTRLLNKPFELTHSWFGAYKADTRADKWFALYEPQPGASTKYFKTHSQEADRFVIDISDVVDHSKENVLRFNASGLSKSFYEANKIKGHRPAVVFHDLQVKQENVPTKLSRYEEKIPRAVIAPRPLVKYELSQLDSALNVSVKGERIDVYSVFSKPGGGESKIGKSGKLMTNAYKVERRIERRKSHIRVFDTLTSLTNELIGVKVRHEIAQEGFDPVYVAGDKSPCSEEFFGGRNPSVFAVNEASGVSIALLAENDVFRVQNVQYCRDGFFGIKTDTLALPPGKSQTIEWSIYPVCSTDYFDFVNTVREDWGVNFPIAGSFNLSMNCFRTWTPQTSDRAAKNMGLGMNTFGVHYWSHLSGEYAKYKDGIWGMGLNSDKVRVRIFQGESILESPSKICDFKRSCIAKCREWVPYVKILSYFHGQISVAADDHKYDKWQMVNAKGKKMNYNGGPTQKIFVPTKNNKYGRDCLDLANWYLDAFDLDGIYIDEINHCNGRIYFGTNMWDGVSVELDKNNNVQRKISYVCLLKLGFTLEFFDNVLNKRGKILVGNFSPETRSERQFRFPRFEETYSHRWIALSHLYTPIQLGDMLTYRNTPVDMAADQRMALMRGALYYHYLGHTRCSSLSSKMFPFTPIELHQGYLVGKERILTAISGDFAWRGERVEALVYVFDELGREVKDYPYAVRQTNNGTVFSIELKDGHCAAIVRK